MSSPMPERRYILFSVILMFLIVLISGGMAVYVLADEDLHETFRLTRVAIGIDRVYKDDVDWDRLLDSGIDAIFDRLDRFSTYHDVEQFDRISEEMTGKYTGIGVTVIDNSHGLLVIAVREDGPADEVGMLTGDIIIWADSTDLKGLSAADATGHIRGIESTTLNALVFRPSSGDTLDVDIVRRRINLVHIPYAGFTADSMIYVRMLDFDAGASDDLEAALDSLMSSEDIVPQGVVLDLRENPGGLFQEAYRTANLFLDGGQFIVGTKGRSVWNEEEHYSTGSDLTGGLPMAVIVDGGSASSAEIVAGALQQLDRAVLVGDTTFGKGLVQGFTRLLDGGALRLTVSRYYLEGGIFLNEFDSVLEDVGHGLVPDYALKFVDHETFPMTLEYTRLLDQFGNLHSEEIIDASRQDELDDLWVARFREYAWSEQFQYISPVTEAAAFLLEISRFSENDAETRAACKDLKRLAHEDDINEFIRYGDYIKMRLKEIAWEHQSGGRAAYERAIVPYRPDIRFAAELLKEDRVDSF